MNKDAQRRIVLIVVVAIICSMFGSNIDKENLKKNPAITVGKWNQMLSYAFQTDVENGKNAKKPLTGEYVAETIMEQFGESRIALLAGDKEYKNGVEFAVANGIISRNQVKSEFSQEAADRALTIAIGLYTSDRMYPQYDETIYKDNVVQAYDWEIVSGDDDLTSIVVNTTGEVPKEGEILLLHDENGIGKARRVVSCQENGQNGYALSLTRVEDLSEIAEVISFSGVADFSSLGKQEVEQTAYIPMVNTAAAVMPGHKSAFIVDGAKNLWDGAVQGWNDLSNKVDEFTDNVFGYNIDNHGGTSTDFTIGLAIEIDDEGKKSIASIVKLNGVETEFGIDEDGKLAGSISFADIELEAEESDDDDDDNDDNDGVEEGAKARIEGTVSLNDFCVATKGFLVVGDWFDEDNYFDVTIDTDVVFNLKVSGEFEGRYKISDAIQCPIPFTFGAVAVEFVPYLLVNAEGEISLTWGIEGITTGMNVSVKDGIDPTFNVADKTFSAEAKIEIQTGVAMEVAISFFELDLIDPGVEILPLTVTGEVLPKNKGFENYPPCMQLGIRGIDLSLSVSYGDDSAVYHIMKAIDAEFTPSFTLIDSENTPLFKKEAHIEINENGKPVKVEECTRVNHDPLGDIIDDAIGGAMDVLEDEANSWLEDSLNDLLPENCGGCY